jgi:predicted ATP-dependent serine protease
MAQYCTYSTFTCQECGHEVQGWDEPDACANCGETQTAFEIDECNAQVDLYDTGMCDQGHDLPRDLCQALLYKEREEAEESCRMRLANRPLDFYYD